MPEWNGSTRVFRQENGRKHTRVWSVYVSGPSVHTSWGVLGGSMQDAVEQHVGVNHGKANYLSPEAYALDRAGEQIRKKRREGYREYVGENPVEEASPAAFSFDALPENLCFYKPDNSMGAGMLKKAAAGGVTYSRKRNGLAFEIARGSGGPVMYSRRMLRQHDLEIGTQFTWNDRFPHIIEAAEELMPANSIILGELVMDRSGADDFKHVQSVTKSLTPESISRQASEGWLSFYIWDIAFWSSVNFLETMTIGDRYGFIHELDYTKGSIIPVEVLPFENPDRALAHAIRSKWEGFVVTDPEGMYGDKAMNFKGKPDRPGKFCAKLKPSFEDDFIAYWNPEAGYGEYSTKDRYALNGRKGIESVALYQRNSKGEQVYISNISSGMTEEMKRDLADPSLWPQVWEVRYDERTFISQGDDTNALTFARYVRTRDDKKPDECTNTEL